MAVAEVALIDSGGANIASLQYALERINARSVLTSNAAIINSASHVILPGVGAAAAAMQKLDSHNLGSVIRQLQQPVLGICLGMQLLANRSEEDDATCIGIFPGTATKLISTSVAPVPNMGWCRTYRTQDHPLLDDIDDGSWFYFVHSFVLPVSEATVATATHTENFAAIESTQNFHATQFHPERSSKAGSQILRNFLAMQS